VDWRRRIVVLLVLLVILVVLGWLLWGRGGGGTESSGTATASPTAAPTGSASPTSAPTPTESPSPTQPNEIRAGEDNDNLVEAQAELAIYPVGSTPQLILKVTNIGTKPCRRDVGPGANELKIAVGDYGLWSSDDCNPSQEEDVITLDRGDEFETQLTWDGRVSEPGCPPEQPIVGAGEYSVIGRNGEAVSAPSGLRLE
ncbi:MAG: hypothetical protein ACKOT0_05685, partial [bacterium]